ncbi:Type VI secretion lipoprotein [Pseudovibrio axinellae]|uniref:Type VI secretion lipoprotein n=1 Tax=Pseudovibrio axinellae TaxID=989403 RepID=A0A161X7P9_9HYPH|nr:type VI secretion system lipoprotein TssJ [Pseudovibrio axinellae]KZL05023.1 Type VI secretion lipoprotein [Pseudovibrio axinellae]SER65121.1 type VI secretion system protein VasD [Pseudovibrio axinellae]
MNWRRSRSSFVKRGLQFAFVSAGLFAMTACGAQKIPEKVFKVLADPDIPVGEPKDQPTLIDVTVFAENGANRNDLGEYVPIDVWIFQLGDDGKLLQSSFDEATQDYETALGTTFIDVKEVQVMPGESKVVSEVELDEDTVFIGLVGGYSQPEKVDWRAVEQVKPKGEVYKLLAVMSKKKIITNLHR